MRIQVLRLPLYELSGISEEPFALIVDQAVKSAGPPEEEEGDDGGWSTPSLAVFAEQIGARGVWVTRDTVEIVEPCVPELVDHVPLGPSDWHAVVLRDGMGVVGIRADQGRDDPFFGYAELYLRSIYLDAILLGVLQKQGLTRLEERLATALDASVSATMATLEQEVSSFRHRLWAQHLTPHGIPNSLLTAYQKQHALRERFEQILTEISDFNRLTRDDESRRVNGAVVVFTLVTVPAGVALALLQVLETSEPWLFVAVGVACLGLTVLLLSTRSARVAFRALRNRFTLR